MCVLYMADYKNRFDLRIGLCCVHEVCTLSPCMMGFCLICAWGVNDNQVSGNSNLSLDVPDGDRITKPISLQRGYMCQMDGMDVGVRLAGFNIPKSADLLGFLLTTVFNKNGL